MVEPYPYSRLKTYNSLEVQLNNWLVSHWYPALTSEYLSFFEAELKDVLGEETLQCLVEQVFMQEAKAFLKEGFLYIYLTLEKPAQIFIALPISFARLLISRILGVELPEQTPLFLSEIEKGILEFLCLKIIGKLVDLKHVKNTSQVELAKIGSHVELKSVLDNSMPWVMMDFKVLGGSNLTWGGFIGWQIPSLLSFRSLKKPPLALGVARAHGLLKPLCARIGRIPIALSDVKTLEQDDIVILENSSLKWKEMGLFGNIQCTVGLEEGGIVMGKLFINHNGKYAIQVTDLISTGKIQEGKASGKSS